MGAEVVGAELVVAGALVDGGAEAVVAGSVVRDVVELDVAVVVVTLAPFPHACAATKTAHDSTIAARIRDASCSIVRSSRATDHGQRSRRHACAGGS